MAVIVIADTALKRETLRQDLEAEGIAVLDTAPCTPLALAKVERHEPRSVVMSHDMADGDRLVEWLNARWPDLPVTFREIGISEPSLQIALDSPSSKSLAGTGVELGVVLIGASTGGPEAVGRLVGSLRPNLDVPIVLVQHMPEAFLGRFVERLADASPMPVEIAGNKQPVRPGRLIVAPGGVHLRMTTGLDMPMFKLEQGPPINGVCPAVDPLFADGARLWGHRCLAIVLTGMGRDGADGAQAVHDAGGLVWVQDRDSSVVWGMPKAVSQKEIHTLEASPEGLARSLNEIAPRQRLGVR